MSRPKTVLSHPAVWLAGMLALIGLTRLAWDHRFVRSLAVAAIDLAQDGAKAFKTTRGGAMISRPAGAIEIRGSAPTEFPTVEVDLARFTDAAAVMIDYSVKGAGLEPGNKNWERARIVPLWRDPNGHIIPHVPLIFAGEGDFDAPEQCCVLDLHPVVGKPSIAIQNLGRSGTFRIHRFRITPVGHRPGIGLAFAGLAVAWGLGLAAGIRRFLLPGGNLARVTIAAVITVAAASYLVFPGPWEPRRPVGPRFELGEVPPSVAAAASAKPSPDPGAGSRPRSEPDSGPEPLVEPPEPHTFTSRLFELGKVIRKGIHAATYIGMALFFRLLLPSRRAWWLPALIGVGAEAMQVAFGFGFELLDGLDLALDALGIGLGQWLATRRIFAPLRALS